MGVSRDIREDFSHVGTIPRTRSCHEAQPVESRQGEMRECQPTLSRRGGELQVYKGGECDDTANVRWMGGIVGNNRGGGVEGQRLELGHFVQHVQPSCDAWPPTRGGGTYVAV